MSLKQDFPHFMPSSIDTLTLLADSSCFDYNKEKAAMVAHILCYLADNGDDWDMVIGRAQLIAHIDKETRVCGAHLEPFSGANRAEKLGKALQDLFDDGALMETEGDSFVVTIDFLLDCQLHHQLHDHGFGEWA